jgi:putative phosphoesterase
MKIGIISDTHDAHQSVLKAVKIFNEYEVKYVLHAGDIISPFTAKAFAEVKDAKFIAVFGNNEGEKLMLKSTIVGFGGEIHDIVFKGEIAGKKIFMTHVPTAIDEVVGSGHYDIVIYGHTHRQDLRLIDNTLVINPGEATDWISGRSTLVILETDNMSYEVVPIQY